MEETTILKENAMSGKERITFIKDINNCNLENLRSIQMAINFWCWKRGNKKYFKYQLSFDVLLSIKVTC